MNQQPTVRGTPRTVVLTLQRFILLLARYWFLIAMLLTGAILASGFLAPAFMAEGQPQAGEAIYRFLAPHNHQLPQRSYFLFGRTGGVQTYSLEELLAFGANPRNLQNFVGSAEIGYKTALNHRMIAIFTGIFIGGMMWVLTGQRLRLSFIWFLPFALPLIFDGLSHMVSENSGEGFRQSNTWAVTLTGGGLPASFYSGTTFGTLNWLLRTVTGLLFGLGLAWFLFPYLARRFMSIRLRLEPRLKKIATAEKV